MFALNVNKPIYISKDKADKDREVYNIKDVKMIPQGLIAKVKFVNKMK